MVLITSLMILILAVICLFVWFLVKYYRRPKCVMMSDSDSCCYIDGAPDNGDKGTMSFNNFSVCHWWGNHTGLFALEYDNQRERIVSKPRIALLSNESVGRMSKLFNRLFFFQWNLSKIGFKDMFICVRTLDAEEYVNAMLDSKNDRACDTLLGYYRKNRSRVHVIPNSVYVACEK